MLQWSKIVNQTVSGLVEGIGPFNFVRESLGKAKAGADLIVVSQTPTEALVREWQEHRLNDYVRLIAGQELGTKAEHLQLAAAGKYPEERILMISR